MSAFVPVPLKKDALLNDPQADIRSAEKIEKYKISENALYIPYGFKWQYLPLDQIVETHRAVNQVTSEGCCDYAVDLPAIAVKYGDDKIYLDFNEEKNAERMRKRLGAE
jgi:hypothetical protein